jgi:hypothetical protein
VALAVILDAQFLWPGAGRSTLRSRPSGYIPVAKTPPSNPFKSTTNLLVRCDCFIDENGESRYKHDRTLLVQLLEENTFKEVMLSKEVHSPITDSFDID